ncbi:sugar O-acyltransferase, sialic acid O-acetyltransferase NeuD family [Thermanaerovibrio velox DSM 12556]|uniref:Sugar O-acyltransferase, sialic acid O-acetyltransferase NeuD family n=1 Tax=Thermanaerovibrio velox DSM 12556 TaxID=926567 RepID=H0UMU9_9BACT|nr:acetyltransferase [Thermanaerovibrio velox]EHM09244.1 sugar O-acyltransferase, sialic acid O-acetyltransferase NeuD family [Thermanaerovibrio velox DSM 12556]
MRKPLYVIGAGGHGKVVISTLIDMGLTPEGVLDDYPSSFGKDVLGIRVFGAPEHILSPRRPFQAVIAVGDNKARRDIEERLRSQGFSVEWIRAVHPTAYVHPSVEVGEGTVVFAGAVVQPGSSLGRHCIVNTGAKVDHDCVIGDFAHIAPGCSLAGGVRIGEGAFVGIGSAVIPCRTIGPWSTVGAGSTVIRDVAEQTVVAGCPARPIHKAAP